MAHSGSLIVHFWSFSTSMLQQKDLQKNRAYGNFTDVVLRCFFFAPKHTKVEDVR